MENIEQEVPATAEEPTQGTLECEGQEGLEEETASSDDPVQIEETLEVHAESVEAEEQAESADTDAEVDSGEFVEDEAHNDLESNEVQS